MGFQRDSNGWSIAAPSGSPVDGFVGNPATGDTRQIHVSDTDGIDSPEGSGIGQGNGSKARPYKTIAKGRSRLRPGSPDQLLLATGDTFTNQSFIDGGGAAPQGMNPTARMIYSSYDRSENFPNLPNPSSSTPQPLIKTQIGASAMGYVGENFAAMGLNFYAWTRDPSNPAFDASNPDLQEVTGVITTGNAQTIEDCSIRFYHMGVEYAGKTGDSNGFYRCRIVDCYNLNDKVGGGMATAGGIQNNCTINIEQCFFDINGWNPIIFPGGSGLNHNIYSNANNTLIPGDPNTFIYQFNLLGNISARESPVGTAQSRAGGHNNNNLWINNGTAACVYGMSNPTALNLVENDVCFGGQRDNSMYAWAGNVAADDHNGKYGSYVTGMAQMTARNCIVTQPFGPNPGHGAMFAVNASGNNVTMCILFNNIAFRYATLGGMVDTRYGDANYCSLSGYNYVTDTPRPEWPHPYRDLASYMRDVVGGGSTIDDFYAACRLQRKGNWNPLLMAESVNDYIREGFAVPFIGSAYAGGFIPPPPNVQLSPSTLPNGTVGVAYSQTITATGGTGPYTFTLTGSLPAGLSFDSGLITGIPTVAGTYSFSVNVTDSLGTTGSQSYTMTIAVGVVMKPHPPQSHKPTR